MRVRYTFPLDRVIKIDDYWPLEIEGGRLELVPGDNSTVIAINFEKSGLPYDFSIQATQTPEKAIKGTISIVDPLLPLIRDRLNNAFAFLRCMFGAGIALDRVTIECEAESPDEEELIAVKSFSMSKKEEDLSLSFDFISRSLMAAESFSAPHYEAELMSASREALEKSHFIDAFRYAFLLLEALHGNGKFRSAELIKQFNNSQPLKSAIEAVVGEWSTAPIKMKTSDTFKFLMMGPATEDIIKHIVSKRGHYFHGNVKKNDFWKPHEQNEAEALAWLCVSVALKISFEAAGPIFKNEYVARHFAQAKAVGAIFMIKAVCKFRIPEEGFIRSLTININCPGSKAHTVMLMKALPLVLEKFENMVPLGKLHSIIASSETGDELFRLRFATEPDGIEAK